MNTGDKEKTGAETDLALAQNVQAGAGPSGHASEMLEMNATAGGPVWPVVDWLPISLAVDLPVPAFRVRDMLALEVGSVVATKWPQGEDLPLAAGTVQLAWVDVEVVDQAMSVRLTRLL